MWKTLVIIALFGTLLMGRPCVAQQQQSIPHAPQNKPAQAQRPVPPTHIVIDPSSTAVHIKTETDNAEKAPPEKPRKQFLTPEWVIVYITAFYAAISVLMLIAVKQQANHIVTSERAWITTTMGTSQNDFIFAPERGMLPIATTCILKNKGKTPAFILEFGGAIEVIGEKESLPDVIPSYNLEQVFKWGNEGIPISPKVSIMRGVVKNINDPIDIWNGSKVLWVYGYVKYRDAFCGRGKIHETRYCFRFAPVQAGIGEKVQFLIDGPESYNRAT